MGDQKSNEQSDVDVGQEFEAKTLNDSDINQTEKTSKPSEINAKEFIPVLRSGSFTDIGLKPTMEDEHICIDYLNAQLRDRGFESPPPAAALYGVFDGHSGSDAAKYIKENLLNFMLDETNFPQKTSLANAFAKAEAGIFSAGISRAGTTALAALIWGKTLFVANAGDCRAVLGRRGKAIDLTTDHRNTNAVERSRVESVGGSFDDEGYLNGNIAVTRALGDWTIKKPYGDPPTSPLSAEPELMSYDLAEEDEFLIIACDGIFDVMASDIAEKIVRRELILHNDPAMAAEVLGKQALDKDARDNLTVLVICFSRDPPPKKIFENSKLRTSQPT